MIGMQCESTSGERRCDRREGHSGVHYGGDPRSAWDDHVPCRQCGLAVESERRCYAIPTCYACLPPPEPLPIAEWPR